jgi:hypothetical protein
MRLLMRSFLLVLAWCGAAGVEVAPPPDPVLGDALAVLHINDPQWLDREATRFATTLGVDPAPLRGLLAKLLFRSRSLEGIDLTRPALIAWRNGPAALVAIIPLANRRAFVENFGVPLGDEAPLICVGEREGTMVYSQNSGQGLVEYRLLVSDETAFLARTTEQCRVLAAKPLRPLGLGDPPVTFTANVEFLKRQVTGLGGEGKAPSALAPVTLPLAQAWGVSSSSFPELAAQVASVTCELKPDSEGGVRLLARLQAMPDSALTLWIGNQKNQASRLLPLVRSPATFLTFSGNIAWQGQCERIGQVLGETMKTRLGQRWTAIADEAWRGVWSIIDRSGPFAGACDVDFQEGQVRGETRFVCDQPRAQEFITLVNSLQQTLTGASGEVIAVAGCSGYRERSQTGNPAGVITTDAVVLATERYLVQVQSSLHDAAQVAGDLAQRSQNIGMPEGAVGVAAIGINLSPLFHAIALAMNGGEGTIQGGVDMTLLVKTVNTNQMTLELTLPLVRMAQAIRDSGMMMPPSTDKKP